MTSAAYAAWEAARPAIEGLRTELARDGVAVSPDRAAAAWAAVAAVLGTVAPAGTAPDVRALVTALRQQGLCTLDEAHALLDLHAFTSRVSADPEVLMPATDASRHLLARAEAALGRVVRTAGSAGSTDALRGEYGRAVAAAPAGMAPAGMAPAGRAPAGTPPAGTPPAGTPPAGTPPAGTPPAGTAASPPPPPPPPPVGALPPTWPGVSAMAEPARAGAGGAPPPPVWSAAPGSGPVPSSEGRGGSRSSLFVVGLVVVCLLAAGVAAFLFSGVGKGRPFDDGVAAYQAGQRMVARLAFEKALAADPNDARPLIYLGRLSREEGDLAKARRLLEQAVQRAPDNPLTHRELASALLADGQPELARRFYVRALELDPRDRMAQGFLGCALVRLGRTDEARRWFERAGPGDWMACASAAPITPPGAVRP